MAMELEIGSEEYMIALVRRSHCAALLLLEQGHGAEVAEIAWFYSRCRTAWESRGRIPGELQHMMDLVASTPRFAPIYAALPELWPKATIRFVDDCWTWICGTEPMPELLNPQQIHPLDRLAEEVEIERYRLLGSG